MTVYDSFPIFRLFVALVGAWLDAALYNPGQHNTHCEQCINYSPPYISLPHSIPPFSLLSISNSPTLYLHLQLLLHLSSDCCSFVFRLLPTPNPLRPWVILNLYLRHPLLNLFFFNFILLESMNNIMCGSSTERCYELSSFQTYLNIHIFFWVVLN